MQVSRGEYCDKFLLVPDLNERAGSIATGCTRRKDPIDTAKNEPQVTIVCW
jgi:hypothetical protein